MDMEYGCSILVPAYQTRGDRRDHSLGRIDLFDGEMKYGKKLNNELNMEIEMIN